MSALVLYGVPGKMTRRLAGVVIGAQGLAVFFGALVARALASAKGSPTANTFLLLGSLLAVLCILDAGLLRRPWGITLGWVLQVATLACALVVPLMLLVGALFAALWTTTLVQGHNMDERASRVDAQWYAEQQLPSPDPSATETPAQDG
jgi:putative exporter of polyketide antibiotics